jgi:hypothetical protein
VIYTGKLDIHDDLITSLIAMITPNSRRLQVCQLLNSVQPANAVLDEKGVGVCLERQRTDNTNGYRAELVDQSKAMKTYI